MVVPRPRPRRVRLPLLAIVLLASCSVGLDACFLERLDYGMEHQQGVPGEVLMAPIWFVRDLIYGDVSAHDVEVRAFLLRVAPCVPFDEVCAAIGAPTAEWEALDNGGPQRLCVYDFGFGYSHTLGFLDGRLLWIEFGP